MAEVRAQAKRDAAAPPAHAAVTPIPATPTTQEDGWVQPYLQARPTPPATPAASLVDRVRGFVPRAWRPPLRPRGLSNLGNMCYMNALLQPLVFCGPLARLLTSFDANALRAVSVAPLFSAMYAGMKRGWVAAHAQPSVLTTRRGRAACGPSPCCLSMRTYVAMCLCVCIAWVAGSSLWTSLSG
jgi:hypothetical protein